LAAAEFAAAVYGECVQHTPVEHLCYLQVVLQLQHWFCWVWQQCNMGMCALFPTVGQELQVPCFTECCEMHAAACHDEYFCSCRTILWSAAVAPYCGRPV